MVQTIKPAALRWRARTILHKQLSETEIERSPVEAKRLHQSIVQPLLSPGSDHCRALQRTTKRY